MRYALIQTQLLLFGLVAVAAYLLATRESIVARGRCSRGSGGCTAPPCTMCAARGPDGSVNPAR